MHGKKKFENRLGILQDGYRPENLTRRGGGAFWRFTIKNGEDIIQCVMWEDAIEKHEQLLREPGVEMIFNGFKTDMGDFKVMRVSVGAPTLTSWGRMLKTFGSEEAYKEYWKKRIEDEARHGKVMVIETENGEKTAKFYPAEECCRVEGKVKKKFDVVLDWYGGKYVEEKMREKGWGYRNDVGRIPSVAELNEFIHALLLEAKTEKDARTTVAVLPQQVQQAASHEIDDNFVF